MTYGEPRVGKSVYELLVEKDLSKWWANSPEVPQSHVKKLVEWANSWGITSPEVNFWRALLTFKPVSSKQDRHPAFVDMVKFLVQNEIRAPLGIWDDAGVWMFALDYQDPRVKSALKILQVAGTAFGGLKMTTPSIKMILKKVLEIEGIHVTKVIRNDDLEHPLRRLATTYRNTMTPWGKRYLNPVTEDSFNVFLPNEDYNWYQPIREQYLKEALRMMEDAYGIRIRTTADLVRAMAERRSADYIS